MEISSSDNPECSELIKSLSNEEICSKGIDDSHIPLDDSENSTENLHLQAKNIPFACSSAEDSNKHESSSSSRHFNQHLIEDNCKHERKYFDYEDDIKIFESYTSDSFSQMLHLCEVLENLDLSIDLDGTFCIPTNSHFNQNPVAVKNKEITDKQNSTLRRRKVEDIHFDFSLKQADTSKRKNCCINSNCDLCLDPLMYYNEKPSVASLKRKHEYEGGNTWKDLNIPDTPQTLVLSKGSNEINLDINFQVSKKKKSS